MSNISNLNNSDEKRVKVLVAPLDWGLGHATRCIPIIKALIGMNCEVILAAGGSQKTLLEQEFPTLRILEIGGYGLKYGHTRFTTHIRIFQQVPKILMAIKRENRWLKALLDREPLDAVISDNRYGLYARSLLSVFITHQLNIRVPFGRLSAMAEAWLRKIHYRYIGRFSYCWIPDFPEAPSLAGRLAHPPTFPSIATRYIGLLSRFTVARISSAREQAAQAGEDAVGAVRNMDAGTYLLFLLSGPEPQRSLLEECVRKELNSYPGKAVVVRGLPGGKLVGEKWQKVKIYDHLPAVELETLIAGASLVICRAGYSTIMDLAVLGKRAVLIPTPGQSEQEYLGRHLSSMGLFLCVGQDHFSLPAVLAEADRFPFIHNDTVRTERDSLLREAIGELFGGATLSPV